MGNKVFDIFEMKVASHTVEGTSEKPDSVKLSEELETAFRGDASAWMAEVVRDQGFVNGVQWKKSAVDLLLARNQMPIVVNVTHQAVEQAVAMLTTNDPRFTAAGQGDEDTKVALGYAMLMTDAWNKSNGKAILKMATRDYYTASVGWVMAYYDANADNGAGGIRFSCLDPREVLVDPSTTDISAKDASHILIAKTMTGEQLVSWLPQYRDKLALSRSSAQNINRQYSDRYGTETQGDDQLPTDSMHVHFDVIDRYSRVKRIRHRVVDSQNYSERILEEDEFQRFLGAPAFIRTGADGKQAITLDHLIAEADAIFEKTGGLFHVMITPEGKPQVMPGPIHQLTPEEEQSGVQVVPESETTLEKVMMGDLLEQGMLTDEMIVQDRILRVLSVGGALWYEGILEISNYPMVPAFSNFNRTPFNYSYVRGIRGLQEYINKMYSLIVAHAASSTNVKLLIPRGSQNIKDLEMRWGKAGTAVIEYDPELGAPIVAGPVPLPNELYKNVEDAIVRVQDRLGIYALMQGSPQQAPETHKGTLALEEFGQRRIRSMRDDIEGMLTQLGRVVSELITGYYTEYRIVRVLHPNLPMQSVAINTNRASEDMYQDISDVTYQIKDVSTGNFDIHIVSGSTLPSNRWALSDYYMTLYEKGVIDRVEVLKKTEVADMEGVLSRFNEIDALKGQIEQLNGQLKQVTGDLQTAQREAVHAKQMVEVVQFKAEIDGYRSKMDAGVEIFGARLTDEIKNAKRDAMAKRKGGK